MLTRAHVALALLVALAVLVSGPALAQDDAAIVQRRTEIREMVHEALANLFEAAPAARTAIEHSAGYGVFSTFGIKIFFAGGTTGKGVVINNVTHRSTFMKMAQVHAGLGLGIKKERLVFVFETQKALRDFVTQGWDFGGQASAAVMVADKGGCSRGPSRYPPACISSKITETGRSASLTLSGNKFFRDDELN